MSHPSEKQPSRRKKLFPSVAAGMALLMSTEGAAQRAQNVEVSLAKQDAQMSVRDFLHDPGVRRMGSGDQYDYYALVGNPQSEENADGPYRIIYTPLDRSFGIFLSRKPLSETRKKAAADLARRLGLSSKQICLLAVEVGTSDTVDTSFGSRSLGLPGCPGAVKLPGD